MNREIKELVFRACPSTYIVFTLIAGVPLLITAAAAFKNREMWQPVVMIVLLLIGCFLWIGAFKIVLTEGILSYRTLLRGSRSIPLSEIRKTRIEIGCFNYMDRLRPTTRLVIEPRHEETWRPIIINMRVFGRCNIDQLLDALNSGGPTFATKNAGIKVRP